ncbi:MAG: hypothetical protein Q9164_006323 [Protoblastenia rupestris]
MANFSVLLIDAGDDQGSATAPQVPALQLQSTEYTPMRWDFYVNHYQDEARQAKDTKMTWRQPDGSLHVGIRGSPAPNSTPLGILYPRAGTLGGCTTHNAMITIYPHDSDWKGIQELTGDASWAPDKMRKYFERLENFHYSDLPPTSTYGHGLRGWLASERVMLNLLLKDTKLQWLVIAAARATGGASILSLFSTVEELARVFIADLNRLSADRDRTEGLYQVPVATRFGQRDSTRGFITNIQNAKKEDGSRKYRLDVRLQTLVTRVNFDTSGSTPRAIGVDYLTGPNLYRADPRAKTSTDEGVPGSVTAAKEVILSAGAFNTPQLLKLSGVGPRDELESFQLPLIKELPAVGTNLQDRYETGLVGETDSQFDLIKDCKFIQEGDQPGQDPCLDTWRANPRGDRGTYATNGLAVGIVKKSSVAQGDPDLFIAGAPAIFRGYYPGYASDAVIEKRQWTWITLKAHSRNNAGTITLRSANPRDMPLINFNSFDAGVTDDGADTKDLQAMVEGMKFSRDLFPEPGLINLLGVPSFTEEWPSNNITTDEEWKTFVKNEAWGHHASCTCPIGKTGDEANSVLDSNFKVHGVDGLRVVDASVFPKIPGFYIVTPIYMISEKAADVIIAEHQGISFEAQGEDAKFDQLH